MKISVMKISWGWRRWALGFCLLLGHKKEDLSIKRRWNLTIGIGPLLLEWDVWPME